MGERYRDRPILGEAGTSRGLQPARSSEHQDPSHDREKLSECSCPGFPVHSGAAKNVRGSRSEPRQSWSGPGAAGPVEVRRVAGFRTAR